MKTAYKLIIALALSFVQVIAPSMTGGETFAQTIGDAFYIYRNDGHFNAFFRDEVDSIAYSCYDADSTLYNDIVTQIVYTPDSTYLIPLAAIDSVSFVTPETKYQPGVIVIEGQLREYVVSSDGLTICFKPDTPSGLLPHVGDKLVTTEVSETFFAGFAGQVESISDNGDAIAVTCSAVGLDEVFEEFIFINDGRTGEYQVKGEHGRLIDVKSWEGTYSPGEFSFPLTAPIAAQFKPDRSGDLAYEFAPEASVSITPTYRGKVVLAVSPLRGVNISIDLSEEETIAENLTLSGAVDWTHDFTAAHVPMFNLGVPFLWFYGEVGAFLRANASVSMEQHWKQTFRYTFHYEADSRTFFIPRVSFHSIQLDNAHSGEVIVKGELGAGIYAELGVEFLAKDILSAGGRAEAGIKIGGDVMLYKKDMETALHSTDIYKTLRGNDVHLSGFWNVGLQAQLMRWGASYNFDALSGEKQFARISLVPDFSDVKLVRDKTDSSVLQASAKATGACLPQDLGFTLFEQEKLEDGQTSFSRYGYKGTSADIYASYFNMPTNKRFEVYPTVKLFGVDALTILADPKAEEYSELCPDANHPHVIDLGLPSGTLWACCNVGANAPYGCGGQYAWGETEEKSDYSASTYKFAVASENGRILIDGIYYEYIFIGEDICGTDYDVATVKWSNSWRMPSVTEMEELVSQCTWQLENEEYTYSYKVTGPNGASIVLPGYWLHYWTGNLNHEASYWMSVYSPIPYVLWSDPSPHVHSPVSDNNWLGYFNPGYQGCYVRAVFDSNTNPTRRMSNMEDFSVKSMRTDSVEKNVVLTYEESEMTRYEKRTYIKVLHK